jgi:hypothetical protein
VDGHDWTTNVDSGVSGTFENNPELQEVPFTPVKRTFLSIHGIERTRHQRLASAAEISVLSAQDKAGR